MLASPALLVDEQVPELLARTGRGRNRRPHELTYFGGRCRGALRPGGDEAYALSCVARERAELERLLGHFGDQIR